MSERTICRRCGRRVATDKEYERIPGPIAHRSLCWGEWMPEQCGMDWFEREPGALYVLDLRRGGFDIPDKFSSEGRVTSITISVDELPLEEVELLLYEGCVSGDSK